MGLWHAGGDSLEAHSFREFETRSALAASAAAGARGRAGPGATGGAPSAGACRGRWKWARPGGRGPSSGAAPRLFPGLLLSGKQLQFLVTLGCLEVTSSSSLSWIPPPGGGEWEWSGRTLGAVPSDGGRTEPNRMGRTALRRGGLGGQRAHQEHHHHPQGLTAQRAVVGFGGGRPGICMALSKLSSRGTERRRPYLVSFRAGLGQRHGTEAFR